MTAGTYSDAYDLTACKQCTVGSANGNSYFLVPTNFSGTSNACPWDCNVGYKRSTNGTMCVACSAGTYHATSGNSVYQNQTSVCLNCTVNCTSGYYISSACITTRDLVCTACSPKCPANYYVATECNRTSNLTCQACSSRCPPNYYLSGQKCTGNERSDVVLGSCIPCHVSGYCPSDYYLPKLCPGTETFMYDCVACQSINCPIGTFSTGCGGMTDRYCQGYRNCSAGLYLTGATRDQDGICTPCTNCSSSNQTIKQQCTQTSNTLCGGVSCGWNISCKSSVDRNYFCDYHGSQASCGYCPVSLSHISFQMKKKRFS